jgi:hypothetical protein
MALPFVTQSVAVTNDALSMLAGIAAVSPEKATQFADDIHIRVREAWIAWHLFSSNEDPVDHFYPLLIRAQEALEGSIVRCVTAAREVRSSMEALVKVSQDALVEIAPYYAKLVENYHVADAPPFKKPSTAKRLGVMEFLDGDVIAAISCLARQAEMVTAVKPTSRRGRGRPVGLITDDRRFLLHGLLDEVDKAGGKLTFNKHRETSGIRFLRVLAPFLPPGLVPKAPPLHTLARLFEEWKAPKQAARPKIRTTK